jgi:hypothetical protein
MVGSVYACDEQNFSRDQVSMGHHVRGHLQQSGIRGGGGGTRRSRKVKGLFPKGIVHNSGIIWDGVYKFGQKSVTCVVKCLGDVPSRRGGPQPRPSAPAAFWHRRSLLAEMVYPAYPRQQNTEISPRRRLQSQYSITITLLYLWQNYIY